jgi:hypothetical protein
MERSIEYRLFIWMTDPEEVIQVLALDQEDLRLTHAVNDYDVWRVN